MSRLNTLRLASLAALLLSGCGGPAYRNAPSQKYEPEVGYRFDALERGPANTDQVFVCVTFSGGGVRAAALSYGVLEELRATHIGAGAGASAQERRLLDEVDVISSVSGGSFTSAAYALWREKLFDGHFEREFLKQNVEVQLIRKLLSFSNLIRLPLVILDRIDIVADYFNDNLFEKHTYADLLQKNQRPLVVINSTNMSTGHRFEFTQDDFDVLGSDLASMPLGYAVAASQAVPIIFSPLRLKYYAAEPSRRAIEQVLKRPSARTEMSRRQNWAHSLIAATRPGEEPSYDIVAKEHQYLYLLDGALSDNLGLSYVIDNYRKGTIRRRLESKGSDAIQRLVVIVVNAGTKPPEDIEEHASSPGLFMMGYKTATISIENYSDALIGILRSALIEESHRVCDQYDRYHKELSTCCPDAKPLAPPLEKRFTPYVIEVNFEDLRDDTTRKELLALPTNYHLPGVQTDKVIAAGRSLLRQNPDFQRLLRDLSTTATQPNPERTGH